jgi:hypothetical protein
MRETLAMLGKAQRELVGSRPKCTESSTEAVDRLILGLSMPRAPLRHLRLNGHHEHRQRTPPDTN